MMNVSAQLVRCTSPHCWPSLERSYGGIAVDKNVLVLVPCKPLRDAFLHQHNVDDKWLLSHGSNKRADEHQDLKVTCQNILSRWKLLFCLQGYFCFKGARIDCWTYSYDFDFFAGCTELLPRVPELIWAHCSPPHKCFVSLWLCGWSAKIKSLRNVYSGARLDFLGFLFFVFCFLLRSFFCLMKSGFCGLFSFLMFLLMLWVSWVINQLSPFPESPVCCLLHTLLSICYCLSGFLKL